ncbi:immunity protein Tsi6 family protein [Cysteiniphilum litorale]|uniref:immunity protein Tsi6 family protein n=1 Tax=Cysteiniphilum litorale TaxID=2056700 RepID=UPI003F88493D
MSDRKLLFETALLECKILLDKYPENVSLISIFNQIEYLLALTTNASCDRSRLNEITIGVITAREIESLDERVADLLYKVSGEARLMNIR